MEAGCPTLAISPQDCTRNDLRRSEIQNFLGGGMSPHPPTGRARMRLHPDARLTKQNVHFSVFHTVSDRKLEGKPGFEAMILKSCGVKKDANYMWL